MSRAARGPGARQVREPSGRSEPPPGRPSAGAKGSEANGDPSSGRAPEAERSEATTSGDGPSSERAPEAWVYLLRCADDTLYTGWTNDLSRRLAAHAAGTASRYTRARLPVELALAVAQPDRSAAMREEARIKRLGRTAKLALLGPAAS